MISDRYVLEREIGRGGTGVVWLARDTVLDRPVAIKRIGLAPGSSDPDAERVEREARLSAMINHPHVVAVFDLVVHRPEADQSGPHLPEHWLVMEYVPGSSLAGLIRRDGPLSPDQAAPILRGAAEALEAAHALGIVHRDVKPSNILVDVHGEAKLTDFGIARAETDPALTRTGLVTGSPAYLSPEIASGRTATAQSDVWSLGATLFHALAGHPPYHVGDNVLGAMYRIVHEPPPRLADAGWMAPLLAGTMTHDVQDRWTIAQVREFLDSRGRTAPPVRAFAAPEPDPTEAVRPAVEPGSADPRPGDPGPEDPGPGDPGTATSLISAPVPPVRRARRRPSATVVLALLLALVLLGAGGWIWWDTRPGQVTARTPQTAVPTPTASSEPDQPTAEGMVAFVEDYLPMAIEETRRAFDLLTPEFQAESGDYRGYRGFWGTIRSAEVSDIEADPERLVVRYHVDYERKKGPGFSSDVRLRLEYVDGGYLIAGEA